MVNFGVVKTIMQRLGLMLPTEDERRYLQFRAGQRRCESPMEEAFWSTAFFRMKNYGRLEPQYHEPPYRIDFALVDIPGAPLLRIAIEIDGYDWHKTKEQRNNDTERERYLMKKGWQVIRFTGSQIHADVEACIDETIDITRQYLHWLRTGS